MGGLDPESLVIYVSSAYFNTGIVEITEGFKLARTAQISSLV